MKTIVVGYDGSDEAGRALRRSAELAEALPARLVVVSVSALYAAVPVLAVEAPGVAVGGPLASGGAVPLHDPETSSEEAARRQLDRARSLLAAPSVECEYVVQLGDPAERLLEVAEQRDADLVVVGSRAHGFLERLLVHPVDEAVARRCERDVLLVH